MQLEQTKSELKRTKYELSKFMNLFACLEFIYLSNL
jgi:hypothetical protein